jgi:hypothetical protein
VDNEDAAPQQAEDGPHCEDEDFNVSLLLFVIMMSLKENNGIS